jgi:taurine dioxygenase
MDISVTPIGEALGAEVHGVDARNVDEKTFARIKAAWLEHLVLRFRGQRLGDPELLALTRRFGELRQGRPRPRINQIGVRGGLSLCITARCHLAIIHL